ncbi:hypothetical protein BZG36_00611 [Bifiguratus adelaidae]|uniref:C2 domain-containing protein n=1 Tax=Bifiguratus adelaidae TaxID=1938954 RepID=A0A261Y7K1_9FUNG|nr:hypothetical protein BZG36_00611 [Bifiguratus adelaidae]
MNSNQGTLKVTVCGARDKNDPSSQRHASNSDGDCCELWISSAAGRSGSGNQQTQRTRKDKKCQWNQDFTFQVGPGQDCLNVRMLDGNMTSGGDKDSNACKVKLDKVIQQGDMEEWVKIPNDPSNNMIQLKMRFDRMM